MKRVLITGANSYLGDNTKKCLEKAGGYSVDILDMLDPNWKETDFSNYDVVFNVCAIVHRPKEKNIDLYYKVNRDLAVEIATIAKNSGVSQFIQTSTDGVFGVELGEMNCFRGFHPKTPYEKSKYEADMLLERLRGEHFSVCIIRPPMIYGKGCKGNFPKLEKYALNHSFFPSFKNKRDVIYIENMCDFVKFAIDNSLNETCYPRDREHICVSKMVETIAKINGKRMRLLSVFNPFIFIFLRSSHRMKSVFGDNYCTEKVCSKTDWAAPFSLSDSLKRMYDVRI